MREMSPTANGGGSYPPQYDLQTQAKILQSESVLERVIAKLHLEEKLSAGEGPRPPLCLAQRPGSARVEIGLASRRGPAAGHEEPESQHGGQHAAGGDPLRLQGPAACRRLPQRPDHRVHPAEYRGPLEDHAANRRVADPPDGRRPDQAGEIRGRVAKLCARYRPAVHFGKGGYAAYRGQRRRRKAAAASGGALQGARRACRQAIGVRVGFQRSPGVPARGAR